MILAKYRKKPVVIEAVQLLWETWDEMRKHVGAGKLSEGKPEGCFVDAKGEAFSFPDTNDRIGLKILTPEGLMLGVEGDYIIRGVKGELYPCKPDIFEATYEKVEN